MKSKPVASRDLFLDLLEKLVAAPTVNPPGNEVEAARIMTRFLDKAGISYKTVEYAPKRTNVIATIGRGKKGLALVCHLDVVPPGDGWKTDPLKLTVKGDKAVGRGVVDNKGQLASCLLLMKHIKESGVKLNGRLIVVGCADEEKGSDLGMVPLVKKGQIKADAAIIPDCAGHMEELYLAEKGLLHGVVVAYGKQSHGSAPENGVNAISGMAQLIREIEKAKFRKSGGKFLKRTTVNIGTIEGGVATNVVPAKCTMHFDVRYLPGDTTQSIIRFLKELAKKVCTKRPGLKFDIKAVTDMPPFSLDENLELIKLIRGHAKRHLGKAPKLAGLAGTTVAKQFIDRGITAVGFSPGGPGAHMSNEHISIKEFLKFCDVMKDVVLDYLK